MTLSARDDAYHTLRQRLTSGRYGSQDTLIPGVLSAEFGVSRTPVREALGLLERDGLLRSNARGFTPWVRSDEEVLEMFEVRAILESAVAAAAAERRTESDLVRLREISSRSHGAQDVDEARRCLNLWHDAVRGAARNGTIGAILHTLEAQVKVSVPLELQRGSSSRPLEDRLVEHDAVLAAIVDRDAERARLVMLTHLHNDQRARIQQRART